MVKDLLLVQPLLESSKQHCGPQYKRVLKKLEKAQEWLKEGNHVLKRKSQAPFSEREG